MNFAQAVRRSAVRTPADRNRHVDLLRAFAISVVVIGHWLLVVVEFNGEVDGDSALEYLSWAHPLTWVLQVMPLFFLVGGYAHGASLTSHQQRGGDAFSWLLNRSARLLAPTTTFLVLLTAGGFTAYVLGLDPDVVGLAVWAASIPLWFLAAYISLVLLAPLLYMLHRRFGLAFPAVVCAVVLLLDIARLRYGVPVIGEANYLLVWLVFHQVGFAWRDGMLTAPRTVYAGLAAAGVIALVWMTAYGPYPVSMVGVPGEEIENTSPPSFALLVLGLTQAALALLLNEASNRFLQRSRPWTAVVAINAVVLTLFLWHMVSAVLAGAAVYPTGLMPLPAVDSAEWLLVRVPWIGVCAIVLAVFTAVFARVEVRSSRPGGERRLARVTSSVQVSRVAWQLGVVVGMAGAVAGLLMIALSGSSYDGVGGMPIGALAAYLAGAGLLRLARESPRPLR